MTAVPPILKAVLRHNQRCGISSNIRLVPIQRALDVATAHACARMRDIPGEESSALSCSEDASTDHGGGEP